MSSTFRFALTIEKYPRRLGERDDFFARLWSEFGSRGLVGVHEGTVLSDDVPIEVGETRTWRGSGTVDSAMPPAERDWIAAAEGLQAELYFDSRVSAERGRESFLAQYQSWGFQCGEVEEVVARDWDADWKASFLNNGEGVAIPPLWRVVPPWYVESENSREIILRVNPGAGFGTGTHETTQLCLTALAEVNPSSGGTALDFGSGSGILAIGAAKLGYSVRAVEIDPLAVENARENAELNGVTAVSFHLELSEFELEAVDLVLANILRPVLLEFAPELTRRMKPRASLILSGLIERDVDDVIRAYQNLLPEHSVRQLDKNEWRALVFSPVNWPSNVWEKF